MNDAEVSFLFEQQLLSDEALFTPCRLNCGHVLFYFQPVGVRNDDIKFRLLTGGLLDVPVLGCGRS